MDETPKPKVTIADMAAAASSAPAETPAASPAESQPETSYTFFNVMPKGKDSGVMTQPTLKVEQPAPEAPENKGPSFFSKYKVYIISGAAIVILGPLIYFLATKLGSTPGSDSESLLTPGAVTHKATSTPDTATSTPAGFTTPQDWRDKYFANCTELVTCGDSADPDHDGLTNLQEYGYKTDPNNADSDQDGLSDGDEINIFITDPLNLHTSNDPLYTDSDYFKGGYDIGTGKKMTSQQSNAIGAKMKNFGLHEPTLKTLGDAVNSLYNFSTSASTSTPDSSLNTGASSTTQSLSAKQDRDTQRSSTIKNIEIALVRYFSDNNTYPQTNDFATMFTEVKPYLKVATNPLDPVNKSPYIYSYSSNGDASDFSLTFYSEVANQPISKNASEAQKDAATDEASILDNQRQTDLENIRTALLLYSQSNVAGNQTYVFPATDKYKTALVPNYLETVPKDPTSGNDYTYQVSSTFNTFTLKAVLDNPPTGTTGYMCNQDECMNY